VFQITFTADTACSELPSIARSRTYSSVWPAGSPTMTLDGGIFGESSPGGYRWNVVYANVRENVATLWFQDPEIWEHLDDESYLVVYGGPARVEMKAGTNEPQTSSWPFWGRITYCADAEPDNYPECAVPEISCESAHHTLTLVRR